MFYCFKDSMFDIYLICCFDALEFVYIYHFNVLMFIGLDFKHLLFSCPADFMFICFMF